MEDYGRVHYQFPAFGNWDLSDDMPITQYFESARQAGFHPDDCLWDFDRHAPLPPPPPPPPLAVYRIKGNGTVRRFQNGKDPKKPGRVWDEAQAPRSPSPAAPKRAPKAVDEDLYKIPPELLRKTRRRKLLNFFSRMFRRRRLCY